MKQNEIITQLA